MRGGYEWLRINDSEYRMLNDLKQIRRQSWQCISKYHRGIESNI